MAWPPELRRAALALGLGAAELAGDGAAVTLAFGSDGRRGRLTATVPAARGGRAEGVGVALARRVIEAVGGSLTVSVDAGAATLAADLPIARRNAGAEDLARRA